MKFRAIMPVLKVADMQSSLDFYQSVLGFSIAWRSREDDCENAMLEAGQTALMLSTGLHLGAAPPEFTGTLYFDGSGVREYWEKVAGKAPVKWPLAEMEYGTIEFGITDPDGYTLAFSQAA